MGLPTVKSDKTGLFCAAGAALLAALAAFSLFTGKYPLTLEGLLSGDAMQLRVFWTLRVSRTLVGAAGALRLVWRVLSTRRFSAIRWRRRM